MNTFIVIGAPGQGKSPFVREMIKGRRCFVFDIQNEYGRRTKYPGQEPVNLSDNPRDLRARYIRNDVNEFILLCTQKKDTICVFEEATAFFEGRTMKVTRKHLIDRYHTGNQSVFIFHSINSVPPRIMEMANFVVLFKTLDEEDTVFRKYSRLSQHFLDLQQMPDGSKKIIKLI